MENPIKMDDLGVPLFRAMKTTSSMHPCFIQGSDRARRFMMEESMGSQG